MNDKKIKIIAVSACPTGIAHTFLAKEKLIAAAKKLNIDLKIETQGRRIENRLSASDVEEADVVILAIDKAIEGQERFNGKKVINTSTKNAIKNPELLFNQALTGKVEIQKGAKQSGDDKNNGDEYDWKVFAKVYRNLMGGVSRMLPFVVAGGILLGLGFLFDSGITGGTFGVTRDISGWFAGLGKLTFFIFVPILGAYIAYSIVGSEGLLPGMVAGLIANGGNILYGVKDGHHIFGQWSDLWGRLTPGIHADILASGSGFIGAMVGGYLAALIVFVLRKYVFRKVSRHFKGVVDIVAMPVITVLGIGALMFALTIPLSYMAYGLKLGLKAIAANNLLWLLGIIAGAMMAIDMGGPINKSAYVLATAGLANGTHDDYVFMGIVMIAGMVPPLAIAISTLIFKKGFSKKEREAAKANWFLSASFITEGAIPFAASDPKRVIPSIMLGSMIAGLIMGLLKVGISAPHGGIFVIALTRSYLFDATSIQTGVGIAFALGAWITGSFAGAFAMGIWKTKDVKNGKLVLNEI